LADVVLCDWYEGETLQRKIEECYNKPSKMAALSQMFEEFALSLLNEEWAHGDVKPENIILSRDGFHLIDFDAMYREGFTAEECVEIGTRQYQHPLRDRNNFGRDIDDYPIALIATVLAAMALDPSIGRGIAKSDNLLISPQLAVKGEDKMLARIEALFAECGDVRHYRIAKLLNSPILSLPLHSPQHTNR
jgi:serine/threonine protein kinase